MLPFSKRHLARRTAKKSSQSRMSKTATYVDIGDNSCVDIFEQIHAENQGKGWRYQLSSFGGRIFLLAVIIFLIFGVFLVLTKLLLMDWNLMSSDDVDFNLNLPHSLKTTDQTRTTSITDPYELLKVLHATHDELLKIPRISEHCHRPELPIMGMEGFVEQNYKLEQVHIVILPGESTPSQPTLPNSVSFTQCHFKSSKLGHLEVETFPENINKYLSKSKNIRHFKNVAPLLSEKGHCAQGQITPLGTAQLIGLGKYLRDLYLNKWNLHNSNVFSFNQWLHIRSLDSAHTLHSLLGFMHGFLNKELIHHLEISKANPGFCEDINGICNCSSKFEYTPLSEDVIAASRPKSMSQTSMNIMKNVEVSKLTSRQVTSVVMPFICNKLTPQTNHVHTKLNVTASNFEQILSLKDNSFQVATSHDLFTEFADLNAFPFLTNMMTRFKQGQDALPHKIFVYGADDSFMLSLLATIRLKLNKILRPATRLVFEVYSSNQDGKLLRFLRVLFNGEDVTMKIPLCHRRHGESMCPLKYFVDYHHIKFQNRLPNGC